MLGEREQSIEAREKAASEGPWRWDTEQETKAIVIFRDDGEIILADGDYFLDEDAQFIAHAREDIPYLLAQLGEARAENRALKRRMGKAGWETALLLRRAEGKLEAVEKVRVLIPHATPNEPVYYPDLPQCHPQCQRCKIDRILNPQEAEWWLSLN